jgi:hypothetical protein
MTAQTITKESILRDEITPEMLRKPSNSLTRKIGKRPLMPAKRKSKS